MLVSHHDMQSRCCVLLRHLSSFGFELAVGFFPSLADIISSLESKPQYKVFTSLSLSIIAAGGDRPAIRVNKYKQL